MMTAIAEVYTDATLSPTKMELLAAWLPTRSWFDGDASDLAQVSSYRFVDPEGTVGMETMILTSWGTTYQVPLTYRPEPLEGGDDVLVGTIEHSELGTRYVYDGSEDPDYLAALHLAITTGLDAARHRDPKTGEVTEAPMCVLGSGANRDEQRSDRAELRILSQVEPATPDASAEPSGTDREALRVYVTQAARRAAAEPDAAGVLVGAWASDGTAFSATLATLR